MKNWVVVQKGTAHSENWYVHRKTAERQALKQLGSEGEVLSRDEYNQRWNQPVTVINCVTQKPVTIPLGQQGTCCDPSTERYHCM